jgi:hypothetical protein
MGKERSVDYKLKIILEEREMVKLIQSIVVKGEM